MSGPVPYRNPTWHGLDAGLPRYEPAGETFACAVQEACGIRGRVHVARFDDPMIRGALLEPGGGLPPIFLKLVESSRELEEREGEAIATWLAGRGLPVIAGLPGFPRPLDDRHLLFAYPHRPGRRLRAEPEELRRLGGALARLHATLASYPGRDRIANATARRLASLSAARDALAAGRPAGPDPDALARLANDERLDFRPRPGTATPIHDDLTPGNLLVQEGDGAILFLDFEEARHAELPVELDLGLVLERFVVAREPDDRAAEAIGRAFLDAYRTGGGAARGALDLVASLRARALRSLCTLAGAEWEGAEIPTAEWDKFLGLERRARERAELLRRIGGAP